MNLDKFKKLVKALGFDEAFRMAVDKLGRTKAVAMIDGQEIVDADGNTVDVTAIDLVTGGGGEEEAPADEGGEETPAEGASMSPKAIAELATKAAAEAVKQAFAGLSIDTDKKRLRITGGNYRNDDDQKHGFKHFGEFGYAVYKACSPGAKIDQRLLTKATGSGLQQSTGSDGGFLVPPEFATEVWDGLNEAPDSLLAMTDSYTVTGESLSFPANAETSRATGSRYGGIQAYWISEAAQITSSLPRLRQVKIEPQQVAALVYATDKLLNNASAVEQWLTRAATEEIDFLVGDAIINGDGAGKPLGIVSANCTISVAAETGQAATTIVKENIDKMWARLHRKARPNAVWFYNQDIEPQLEQLSQTVGTGGVPVYLPPGGITEAPNARLKGRPAMPIEYCQTLGTAGDIILADLGYYVTGTAGTVESAVSMHLRFDFAETAFRFMFAVDGQPWLASALTPFNGTNTQSPFITLATRS